MSAVAAAPLSALRRRIHGRGLGARRQRRSGLLAQTRGQRTGLSGHAGAAVRRHPEGPWLRTGDLGFISDGQLFIVGRIKDLLIVYGRNHAPEDIEATISEITKGRVAAISVPLDGGQQLVAIAEFKKRGDSAEQFTDATRDITSAISTAHGLSIADLVLVAPGSIPITTSGKIRRQSCAEEYRRNRFARLNS